MGGNDADSVFSKLMTLPNIEQAVQRYQKMDEEIRQTLSQQFPKLQHWEVYSKGASSGCTGHYASVQLDGQVHILDARGVRTDLPDDQYEQILQLIGHVAQRYGFNPKPQRLHDSTGNHNAVFHNEHDESEVSFGSAKNTSIRTTVGCHLTPESKKRGHPSDS